MMRIDEDDVKDALDVLLDKKRAFQVAFGGPSGQLVLKDFMRFCRVTSPPWGSTPEETARYVGRNEVWHRIMQFIGYTPEELLELFTGGQVKVIKHEEEESDE
jgi:hypothetical protein